NQAVSDSIRVGGGAIANLFGASLTACNATFHGNSVLSNGFKHVEGGALLNDAGSSTVIEDSEFIANQATGGGEGGAIGQEGGRQMTLSRCTFDHNSAPGGPNTPAFGGAILSSSSGFFFDSPTTLTR